MSGCNEPQRVAREMLSWIGLDLISCTEIQTLWAGYGHICALEARPPQQPSLHHGAQMAQLAQRGVQSLILKIVSPPHGRRDEGHLRKVFSYQVEQYFYDQVAPTLGELPLAKCLVSTSSSPERAAAAGFGDMTASVLTDLRSQYPVAGEKRAVLVPEQVHSAIGWLATFHSAYWKDSPKFDLQQLLLPPLKERIKRQGTANVERRGLWLNGGYTYLATRRSEYDALSKDQGSEWSRAFCRPSHDTGLSVAEMAAAFLTPSGRDFETFLHGDVKSENLFSTESGDQVAFFDFQYAGLGLGVCDLAKLFTCSVPVDMLTVSGEIPRQLEMSGEERQLLEEYREALLEGENAARAPLYDWVEFERHWETALVDWCRFQSSWGFWGNTAWLQARVRSILQEGHWMHWIRLKQAQTHSDTVRLN